VSQFDSKFTRQTPVDSPDDSTLSESANQVFLVSEPGTSGKSLWRGRICYSDAVGRFRWMSSTEP